MFLCMLKASGSACQKHVEGVCSRLRGGGHDKLGQQTVATVQELCVDLLFRYLVYTRPPAFWLEYRLFGLQQRNHTEISGHPALSQRSSGHEARTCGRKRAAAASTVEPNSPQAPKSPEAQTPLKRLQKPKP